MSEWQPIETAPFTETVLTLWDGVNNKTGKPVHYWEIAFKDNDGCWLRADDFNDQIDEPTHWMPLPDPPATDAKQLRDPKDTHSAFTVLKETFFDKPATHSQSRDDK